LNIQLKLIDWDLTERLALTWDEFDQLTSFSTMNSDFIKKINGCYESIVRCRDAAHLSSSSSSPCSGSSSTFIVSDVVAMAAYLRSDLILSTQSLYGEIELGGRSSRGALFFDHYDKKRNYHILYQLTKVYIIIIFC